MKRIITLILLSLSITSFSQTTGGRKNIHIIETINDVFGIPLDSTYRRFTEIKVLPEEGKAKIVVDWYLSKAAAINTASDVNKQINYSIQTFKFNIDDIYSVDSLAIDTAMDTLMVQYIETFEDEYGVLSCEYGLDWIRILDTIYYKGRMLDSLFLKMKKIEFYNNDYVKAVFEWYMNESAYLSGEPKIDRTVYEKNRTIVELRKPIQDWMQKYRTYLKTLSGYPATNAGYVIEAW